MKIRFSFKTPDAVEQGLLDAGIDEKHESYEEFLEMAKRHFQYGEYVTVELDTDTDAVVVI